MVTQPVNSRSLDQRVLLNVLTELKDGNFSIRMPVDWTGVPGKIADALNAVIDLNERAAKDLERVGRVVGKEGRITERASMGDVRGGWAGRIHSINSLIEDLVWPTSEMARVIGAVANGDLSQKMELEMDGRPLEGQFLRSAKTVNTMVRQLSSFASEVTRVAREVGTEGKLGGQAQVEGVAGVWKDLTDNVNRMASNLTAQVRNIAEVTTAIARGDLSKKITVDVKGEILQLKNTINVTVDQLNAFASEVTRVAREVGVEGKLGGQAQVRGMGGVWNDLTGNVNMLAGNLTAQVRNIADVTTAVAKGDLSKKITVDVQGEILQLKNTINVMVDQLNAFASEVTRVAREVGTEGKLGGQASVPGASGTWKDLTENVNQLAANLTTQVRNIAEVTTAVAKGDLSRKITVDVRGEILQLKNTINVMVDQLNAFASEVTRVAREVGTEGKLGGQAEVKGIGGVWKDLTENVNMMAGNLTAQVRNIADVTTAVARGDLSKKITVHVRGEILQLKNTINVMVDQLNAFASEVTRVAREVGTEGKLGGQASVPGASGTWKDLTENVNQLAANLTTQVRNIAEVTTAVARGDLSKKITVDVRGEILQLKNTINVMVDQLNAFASEVTRVAREVGTEGKLGGQASVPGASGTWKDLTENVNQLAANLTTQVRNIAEVTTAVAKGDLSKKITVDVRGEILALKETINVMVDQLNAFASEVSRVAREVGTEGKLGGQAQVKGVGGTWKDLTENVNQLAANLTTQVRNIAEVTTAVAKGDLSKKITVDVRGEILALKETINVMVDQLNAFASEVSRVAREVGTEGKLGGQAQVKGVAGTWKDLTDHVNWMAGNLTAQVRGIARVVTAVAQGDLKRKLTVEAKGEIAALADTINEMTDTLAIFAEQVVTVAREVGVEGKLGGQASVPGAAGTWKDLTANVNQLAANLTNQVRAIAEVATAVTEGDLTRSIRVEASGEVAALKDKINQMIRNLKETTQYNTEQDWLKTNLAKFTRVLQGQRDLMTVSQLILSELAPLVSAHHGVFYTMDTTVPEASRLRLQATYAFRERKHLANEFRLGEGVVGQCAQEKQRILLTNVPSDHVTITTGLGQSAPLNIIVLPVLFEGNVKAVFELASYERFSPTHQAFLDQLTEIIGIVLNTLEASTRTESLLKQSQSLATELQSRQQELQRTNQELQEKARLLAEQNAEVERKSQEVEQARGSLEEKAEQLAVTSKYKSEFLANMSHELRTPLNSLLLLAQQLGENPERNLSDRQVEFAHIIRSSGMDLLNLIDDILDLSKIESGTVSLELDHVPFAEVREFVERAFRHLAVSKGLEFSVELDDALPAELYTDQKRLQQILRNLLSNAFKFTDQGTVTLRVRRATTGWSPGQESLRRAEAVIAFAVTDTGIGIPTDKQRTIFEAFQQADGTTSRRYGGTGLGLSISRALVGLLGGEIRLESGLGVGSTFTVFLPHKLTPPTSHDRAKAIIGIPARVAPEVYEPPPGPMAEASLALRTATPDDRRDIRPGDRIVLIVEDDANFARVLLDVAHRNGFKGVIALTEESVLPLAREFQPDAVTLDIGLRSATSGWTILHQLRDDPATRQIPIHVVSVHESQQERGAKEGTVTFLVKPVTQDALDDMFSRIASVKGPVKKLLIVEDDVAQRESILTLLASTDVEAVSVATAREALDRLREQSFDGIVLSLALPDISGIELLEQMQREGFLPALPGIAYTPTPPGKTEEARLRKAIKTLVLKDSHSSDRLLEEVTRFLREIGAGVPKRRLLVNSGESAKGLAGTKVLIVDDDIRTIFALTSLLERHQMEVLSAESGQEAIDILKRQTGISIVLMDVMMPVMDGCQTIRSIRQLPHHEALPIIAVTAKAMKGDRERCLEAGASDYIAKPVDGERLVEMIRRWVGRHLALQRTTR